jgi:homocysteine S-methyltransferase
MNKPDKRLPQLDGQIFVTDAGLETELVFHDKIVLPLFASFPLLTTEAGRARLFRYYRNFAELARRHHLGLILESPTWRASADWGAQLGVSPTALETMNRDAIRLLEQVREEFRSSVAAIVISGNLGPRGDGYVASTRMTADEAEAYHGEQVRVFADTTADMVSAFTLNYIEEAIGITHAARRHGLPVVISFTVETDGKLPSGLTLEEAILAVDAATDEGPAYYMINCAHPTHFAGQLKTNRSWVQRVRGLRANASRRSHAELNESPELDEGDPAELGGQYGTDHRHITAICEAVTGYRPAARA